MRVRLDTLIETVGLRFEVVVLSTTGDVIADSGRHDDLRAAVDAAIRSVAHHVNHVQSGLALRALAILRDHTVGRMTSSSAGSSSVGSA